LCGHTKSTNGLPAHEKDSVRGFIYRKRTKLFKGRIQSIYRLYLALDTSGLGVRSVNLAHCNLWRIAVGPESISFMVTTAKNDPLFAYRLVVEERRLFKR
jgi:hypothetical protein